MHEMSVAMSLVELVEETAGEHNTARVMSVTVDVGTQAGVNPDALRFCFDACAKNTALDGSQLVINTITATGYCAVCEKEMVIAGSYPLCETCMGPVKLLTGGELQVRSVEVE